MDNNFNYFASRTFQHFYPKKKEDNIDNNKETKILRILIYIYYFEKDNNKFENKEREFYLINYSWMQTFKIITSYKEITSKLSNFNGITYNNFEKNEEELIKQLKQNGVKIKDNEKFKELSKVSSIIPSQIENEKINSSPFYYAIPSEMKDKLESCFFDDKLLLMIPVNLSFKDNRILIKEKNVIKICELDTEFKITIKYIIIYNSNNIMNLEVQYLENTTIEDYIIKRGCSLDKYYIQLLEKGPRFQEIGKLNVLKNDDTGIVKDKPEPKYTQRFRRINSRNEINNYNKEFLSFRNSPERNKIIQKTKLNLKNNIDNNVNKKVVNYKYKFNDFINNKTNKNSLLIKPSYNQIYQNTEPNNIINLDKDEELASKNKFNTIENRKEKKETYSTKNKYEINLTDKKKQTKNINTKLDEVMSHNKQLESDLEKKTLKTKEAQSNINALTEEIKVLKNKINEYMNIIEKLKEENRRLKEENEIKMNKTKQIMNSIRSKKNYNKKIFKKNDKNLIGLMNLGQISFFNSVIQCLIHTELLSNYFNNTKLNELNPNLKLAISYQNLVKKLSDENIKSFYPSDFINTITEFGILKNNVKITVNNDVFEFLKFILNQLHKELKEDIIYPNNNYLGFKNKFEFDSYNNSIGNEKSIITDIFQIVNENIIQCLNKNINHANYKFEKFFYLSIDLRKEKLNSKQITIKDCLINIRKKLTEAALEYCESCQYICNVNHKHKIFLCPKILMIFLNDSNFVNNIKFNLEEKLNITNLTKFDNDNNNKEQIYKLYGIIIKIKNNLETKYISFCKNSTNNNWYSFDDENTKIIKNINEDINNYGIPLILFYSKINDN